MLSFFCLSNIYGQYHPVDTTDAFFEDAPVFDEICYPLGRIDGIHTLHFESAALVYLDVPTELYFIQLIDSNNNLSTHKIFLP